MTQKRTKTKDTVFALNKNMQKGQVYLFLLAIYIVSVSARFVLALLTSTHPISNIDEFLYYGVARSIATKGELLFRGMYADYTYIVYPLVLSPVYLVFKEGANFYRLIQLWNALLMSLSVFPIYGIAARLLKNAKKALIAAAILMLAGDFALIQVIYSENVIYPLFFAAVFCAILLLEKGGMLPAVLLGVIAGLLYETKPGALVFPVVSLVFFGIISARQKNWRGILHGLVGILACAAICFAFSALLKYVFHNEADNALSLYRSQLGGTNNDLHLSIFFKSLPQYLYYFILACGIACFLVPITRFSGFDRTAKVIFILTVVSLALSIIGTAWTINRYEYATHAVHLRYIGMYIPLFFLFSLVQGETSDTKENRKRVRILTICVLSFVAICAAIWGVGGKENSTAMLHETLSLPYAFSSISSGSIQRLAGLVVIILTLFVGYFHLCIGEDKMARRIIYVLPMFLLIGNITLYCSFHHEYKKMDSWEKPAESSLQAIKGNEYLYVLTNDSYIVYSNLDVRTAKTGFYVTLNDLFNNLYPTGGKYVPYKPDQLLRGTKAGKMTPDTDIFVVDNTVFSMVKLSEYTRELDPENDLLHVLKIQKDKPVFDAVMANVKSNKLEVGDTGVLVLFNSRFTEGQLTIRMKISATEETKMVLFSNVEKHEQPLPVGTDWYEFVFTSPQQAYNFTADSDISVLEYEIVTN